MVWQDIHHKIKPEEVELVRRDYVANEGWETFLAYEDTHQVIKLFSIQGDDLRMVCIETFE